MAKVFISHSWKDNDTAKNIARYLKQDGAEVWIDHRRISGGDSLPDRIGNALKWCDTLVLVWSKSAESSKWVNKEWKAALSLDKKIVPCLLDDTEIPILLCDILYIDFKNFSKGYKELLRALDLEGDKPPALTYEPPKKIPPKKNIPIQKILKIAAIFLAMVMLGITANYAVQKIAASREAKKAYWQKRQTEMNTRFQQAQQIDSDANKSASDKKQIWQQFLIDFAADNPYSQQDNIQRQEATKQRDYWDNQANQEARWAQFQADMNRSYQQALQREKLSSIPAADKAKMWQEFWDQYANKDNPYSQEDNEKKISATQKKDFWLKQAAQETEQARWEQVQADMTKSYNEARQRDRDGSLSPNAKARIWRKFLSSYAADIPNSQQDNDQRRFANERITYWTNYKPPEPKPVAPPQQITVNGITLVLIRGGTFDMGDTFGDGETDEKPVHSVTISNFYMGKTEVSNAQFAAFLNDYGKDKDDQGNTMIDEHEWGVKKIGSHWHAQPGYENHPVIYVTWYGAAQYTKWAGCRLPTEAEWEYAAREGGKKLKWSSTSIENALGEYAWYSSNSGHKTHPVATRKPNALGLYDMSGNVWEWCSDWYDESYYKNSPQNNPKGPASSPIGARVLRGGSFFDLQWSVRCAIRSWNNPHDRGNCVGFRVVLSP